MLHNFYVRFLDYNIISRVTLCSAATVCVADVHVHGVMEQLFLVDLWLHISAVCSGCRSRFFTIDTTQCLIKNTPDIFSCNLNKHFLISIIFSTNIT